MSTRVKPLISYIAPAAPGTRRPARGDEPAVRPEVGFTPAWYRQHADIDFGRRWHTDPDYRREKLLSMRRELARRFPGTPLVASEDDPLDLLTGTFGTCNIGAIYGLRLVYAADNWPNCEHQYLTDREVEELSPADLDSNPHFQKLLEQLDRIAELEGCIRGYVNWQGVLNNAQRLRGEQLFVDMLQRPKLSEHLFACVVETMIEAARRVYSLQRQSGFAIDFFTVSNCLVNMVSPRVYAEQLLPLDRRIAEQFGTIGIHNCAWKADPYLEHYATVPNVAYIDMGLASDFAQARRFFPQARRAVMITPMELAAKPLDRLREDFERIARELAPCDVVLADIEAGMPDGRVLDVVSLCRELSDAIETA